jgi:hypothetical protein
MRYFEIAESSPPNQASDAVSLITWGEQIGVEATVEERAKQIVLFDLTRLPTAEKGSGAVFLRALCAYADRRQKPIVLTVTGYNSQLEDYYHGFGFRVREAGRDAETGDVTMVRPCRRNSGPSLVEAVAPGHIFKNTGKP